MRRAARVDENQKEVVDGLRGIGCSVISLAAVGRGCPDLLVGYRARCFLLEVKDGSKPQSQRKLTPDQREFFEGWRGQCRVVETVEEAIRVVTESYK